MELLCISNGSFRSDPSTADVIKLSNKNKSIKKSSMLAGWVAVSHDGHDVARPVRDAGPQGWTLWSGQPRLEQRFDDSQSCAPPFLLLLLL